MLLRKSSRTLLGCALALTLLASVDAVTTTALAGEGCSNEALREEQHSTFLPDCRAYEMVSPPSKNGGDVIADTTRTRASVDGNAVIFSSLTGFGDAQGMAIAAEYAAVRHDSGWVTHGITPPLNPVQLLDYLGAGFESRYMGEFSPDLSHGVLLAQTALSPAGPNVQKAVNLYLRTDATAGPPGHYALLTDCPACTSPLPVDGANQPYFAGASADYSHVLFESRQNLTAETVSLDPSVGKLYEWVANPGGGGTVRLAGILPDGTAAANSAAGRGAGASFASSPQYTPNTISQDGSRVFFTAPIDVTRSGQLYMRENGTSTVQINAAEPGPDPSPAAATFWAATPDGAQVFFTSPEALTADSPPGGGLYRYTVDAPDGEHLTYLSVDHDPSDGLGANIDGVIGASADGAYVYFVNSGRLVSDPSSDSNAPRIYVWHDPGNGPATLRFVGKINGASERSAILARDSWGLSPKTSRVTPDGRRMVFVSEGTDGLTGYDHGSSCPLSQNNGTDGCSEVYLYDTGADGGLGHLSCVSCNPSGAPATADAHFLASVAPGGSLLGSHQNHPLSDDGRYAFFTTGERLVPEDRNGAAPDAYEYDTTTGQLHLLSTGTSTTGSYFLDASADGHDVFIATRSRLVGSDTDEQKDLYDVRIGGGLPQPPAPGIACSGDSCRAPAGAHPAAVPPGTETFNGLGNPIPALVKPVVSPRKKLTNSQKLSRAMKACRKRSKRQRSTCESQARKRFARKASRSSATKSKGGN